MSAGIHTQFVKPFVAPRAPGSFLDRCASSCVPTIIMGRAAHARRYRDERSEVAKIWRSLLRGECVVIDRFEAGGRRYFVLQCCRSGDKHPRALSEREAEVILHAIRGETHKRIAYAIGLSRSSVTKLLRSALGKLHLRTQAQLVAQLSCLVRVTQSIEPGVPANVSSLGRRFGGGNAR